MLRRFLLNHSRAKPKLTGKLIYSQDIREAGMLMVFLDSFRKLHFGYFGGMLTRILWCIVGLMPLILALTGLYMYLLRTRTKRSKNKQHLLLSTN
jgi:uncharacterized iron-regulated membrane protein